MELVEMYRTETVERLYSKADVAKLRKIGKEIKESKKDPKFNAALRQFIRETTSK